MCSESPPPLPVELSKGGHENVWFLAIIFCFSIFLRKMFCDKNIRLKIFYIQFSTKKILIVEAVNATVDVYKYDSWHATNATVDALRACKKESYYHQGGYSTKARFTSAREWNMNANDIYRWDRGRMYGTFIHCLAFAEAANRPYTNVLYANSLWCTTVERLSTGHNCRITSVVALEGDGQYFIIWKMGDHCLNFSISMIGFEKVDG